MAEVIYNNTKNIIIVYMSFELNRNFHPYVSFEKSTDFCSRSCSAYELVKKLKD